MNVLPETKEEINKILMEVSINIPVKQDFKTNNELAILVLKAKEEAREQELDQFRQSVLALKKEIDGEPIIRPALKATVNFIKKKIELVSALTAHFRLAYTNRTNLGAINDFLTKRG